MTAPRPAGDGGVRACDEPFCTVTLPHHTHVDVADRAWCCGPYPYAARPASPPAPWLATPSEPTVEAELAELAVLRAKVARVEALIETWRGRAVESNGWLITTRDQVRRALDG